MSDQERGSEDQEAPDPWDELEDHSISEGKIVVDAIRAAKKAGQTELLVNGFLSPTAVERLQEKNYRVLVDDRGQNWISWSCGVKISTKKEKSKDKIKVSLEIPPGATVSGNPRDRATNSEKLSPAWQLQQRRLSDDQMFRQRFSAAPLGRS